MGDQDDILFADWSRYSIGLRAEIKIDTSQHVKFTSDELMLRPKMRVDGKPIDKEPETPVKGTQFSPFVVLAPRV